MQTDRKPERAERYIVNEQTWVDSYDCEQIERQRDELLEALEEAVEWAMMSGDVVPDEAWLVMARAAIAKATGK